MLPRRRIFLPAKRKTALKDGYLGRRFENPMTPIEKTVYHSSSNILTECDAARNLALMQPHVHHRHHHHHAHSVTAGMRT
jgi:hypothetical protein